MDGELDILGDSLNRSRRQASGIWSCSPFMIRPLKKSLRLLLAAVLFPITTIALFFISRMGQAAADYLWQVTVPALEENPWWLLLMAVPGIILPMMMVMVLFAPSERKPTSEAASAT